MKKSFESEKLLENSLRQSTKIIFVKQGRANDKDIPMAEVC